MNRMCFGCTFRYEREGEGETWSRKQNEKLSLHEREWAEKRTNKNVWKVAKQEPSSEPGKVLGCEERNHCGASCYRVLESKIRFFEWVMAFEVWPRKLHIWYRDDHWECFFIQKIALDRKREIEGEKRKKGKKRTQTRDNLLPRYFYEVGSRFKCVIFHTQWELFELSSLSFVLSLSLSSNHSKREERIGRRKERFPTKLVKDGNFTLRKNGMMKIEWKGDGKGEP